MKTARSDFSIGTKKTRQPKSVTLPDGRVISRNLHIHTYSKSGRYWAGPDGMQFFRVYGEPMPMAKKEVAIVGGRLIPVDHDYRQVTVEGMKKPFKYDVGYMKRWQEWVRRTVLELMVQYGVPRFAKNVPLAMGMLFYRSKPKSNDLWLPALAPDEDNYAYAIRNILKRTPDHIKKYENGQTWRQPGPYPDGVLYWEDDQICWHTPWDGKVWAQNGEEPGVLISILECRKMRDQIFKLAYPKNLTLL